MKTQILRKFFSLFFVATIIFSSAPFLNIVYGQTTGESSQINPGATPPNNQAAADPSKGGLLPTKEARKSSGVANAGEEAVSCVAGGLVADILTENISSALGTLTGGVVSVSVPTNPTHLVYKEVGMTIGGVAIVGPSWDSIGYCLANGFIIAISDATIAWIESGFQGNPVFADDPAKLFQDIANYELETFLGTLGGGFLCEPFEAYVTLGLIEDQTGVYEEYGRCTLDQVEGNLESFLRGETFSYDTWFSMTQDPANNPYGSSLLAKTEAQKRVAAGVGPVQLELDWGNGFLSWKNEDTGETLTTGEMVSMELEKNLGIKADRLVLADEFDQVLNTLINTLVETALTGALGQLDF